MTFTGVVIGILSNLYYFRRIRIEHEGQLACFHVWAGKARNAVYQYQRRECGVGIEEARG